MRVLAVSPHLDDAAFSVGGTLAALVDAGHDVIVLTVFTRSVPDPTGFALACQTDKGLGPEVDYMALRREEDRRAMAALGVAHEHLDLPEAPHRGYDSAAALFAGPLPGDEAWRDVVALLEGREADLWLGPQSLGAHVDHLHVTRALAACGRPVQWWRDAPYVLRVPDAAPSADVPAGLVEHVPPQLPARRLDACACYASQLGFQFGGEAAMRQALSALEERVLRAG